MKIRKVSFAGKEYVVHYVTDTIEALTLTTKLQLSSIQNFGIDIETAKLPQYKHLEKAGLCPHLSAIRLVQLYDGHANIYVFDLFKLTCTPFQLLLALRDKNFVAHNAIFEIKHFQHAGVRDLNIGCSMILAMMVDRAEKSPFEPDDDDIEEMPYKGFGLNAMIGKLFNIRIDKHFQTSDWSAPELSKEQIFYAALDAVLCYRVCETLLPKVNEYKMGTAYLLLKDMQHVIADMELNGIFLNPDDHTKLQEKWALEQLNASAECAKFYTGLNLNSSKQLGKWALNRFKGTPAILENWKTTASQQLSFNQNVLHRISHLPEIAALLRYKKVNKLISTYGETLAAQRNPATGKIHCSFSLGETRTGRLSSSSPNLQNLPRDLDVRNMFQAAPGKQLVVADFNQIEMRVAGEVSKDATIRKAYENGQDLHTIMAMSVTGKPKSSITKADRQFAKALNFGALFGLGPRKFVDYAALPPYNITITFDEAKHALERFRTTYAGYTAWCNAVRTRAERTGFARTPLGKMRKLIQEEVYTKAPNTGVQGGAFEVLAKTMVHARKILNGSDKIRIIHSVHDEIILEADLDNVGHAKTVLEKCMELGMRDIFPNAPLTKLAKADIAQKWGDAKSE